MILSRTENTERYDNGNVKYSETIGVVSPIWSAIYPNSRKSEDGTLWIRIGPCRKYGKDGKLRWEILYDGNGNVIKK